MLMSPVAAANAPRMAVLTIGWPPTITPAGLGGAGDVGGHDPDVAGREAELGGRRAWCSR